MLNKRLKRIVPWVVSGLLVAFLGGCAGTGTTGPATGPTTGTGTGTEKTYTIRYHHGLPTSHYMAVPQQEWADLVEANSGGRIEVQVYPAEQLYKGRDALEAISTGALEAGSFYIQDIALVVREWEALQVIGTSWTEDFMVALWEEEGGVADVLAQSVERVNLKKITQLTWGLCPPYIGLGGQGNPILVPADLKGRALRSTGTVASDFIASCGGHAASFSGAEIYMALQRGTIDATIASVGGHMVDRKFYEVTDWYVAPIGFVGDNTSQVVMNLDFFNSLPADLQQVVMDAGEEVYQKHKGDGFEVNAAAVKRLQDENLVDVYILTDEQAAAWVDAMLPVGMAYIEQLGPEAIAVYNMVQDILKQVGSPYRHIDVG